jgi:hypothetical protein
VTDELSAYHAAKSSVDRSLHNLAAVRTKAAYDFGNGVITPSELEIANGFF